MWKIQNTGVMWSAEQENIRGTFLHRHLFLFEYATWVVDATRGAGLSNDSCPVLSLKARMVIT